ANGTSGTRMTVTAPGVDPEVWFGRVLASALARATRALGVSIARASKSARLTARYRERTTGGARATPSAAVSSSSPPAAGRTLLASNETTPVLPRTLVSEVAPTFPLSPPPYWYDVAVMFP